MHKTSIKIIKRKDFEAAANVETPGTRPANSAETVNGEKVERLLQRQVTETVSNWVSECRASNRVKEVSAIRRMFGSESLFGKAA